MKPLNQNLMRRFKALLSTIVLLLPLTCLNAEEVIIDSVEYYLDFDEYIVAGYIEGITNAVILDCINGIGVTEIDDNAFVNCKSITSVTIPEGITCIGRYAFSGCTNLKSVTLPSGITKIREYAFCSCASLSSITIPDGVTSIGYRAFFECSSLTSMTIPEGANIDTHDLFSGCSSLKSVTLPSDITTIREYAFYNCTSLSSITIPDGVTSIGNNAFYNCTSLSSITIPDGVTSIGMYAFCSCTSLSSLTIPEGVTSIGSDAFYNCTSLSSITIPDGVTSIGNRAFYNCTSLSSLTIPDGVTSIGSYAFCSCTSLSSLIIPGGVNTIGREAFSGCLGLKSITFDNDVSIQAKAFYGCSNLSSVTFKAAASIIAGAFQGCTNLNTIVAYDVFSMGGGNDIGHLVTIRIKGNTMLNSPIHNYPGLDKEFIYVVDADMYDTYASSIPWGPHQKLVFTEDMLKQKTIEVTADPIQSSLYEQLGDSSLYVANLKIVGSINGYDIMTFRNKTIHLLDLDLSEAEIIANDGGYEYFSGCSLSEDNVLGHGSFAQTDIRSIILPKNLKKIGSGAFWHCGKLESVVINEGLESIGAAAFTGCGQLAGITLPNSLAFLGVLGKDENISYTDDRGVFEGCIRLGPVLRIPDRVTTIPGRAFSSCESIDTIYIGKSVSTIESSAFNGTGAKAIYFGGGVRYLDSYAFQYCRDLETVVLNRGLLRIGYRAFAGCSRIQELLLPFSVEQIHEGAFDGCKSLKTIKIPSMAKSLGRNAFGGCDSITSVYAYTVEPIDIDQNTFNCYLQATLYVPKTSARLYKYNTQWSQFVRVREFEEQYDAFYLNGDFELTERDGRLIGEPDAEMNAMSGFIVEGDEVQELKDVELEHDGTNGATIIGSADDLTGDQVNLTAQSMKVNISVDGNRWYFFCFPFNVEHDSIECTTDYVFYSYDGGKRADGGSGWTKMDSDFGFLQKGVGYIFQTNRTGIITIHVGSEYLTFNANNEKEALSTYTSNDAANAHWNFMGNPFISYYDVQDLAKEYDAPIVVWNGKGYDAYKPGDDDYQLKPFEAFFVQKDPGSSYVEFLPENRITYNQAAVRSSLRAKKRAEIGTPMSLDRQLVNIVLMGQDSISDRTRIVYSTKASLDYEIGVDAAKFHTDGIPEIYTVNGKTRYAINERPMGTDDIKLGYIAPKAGTYTLSVPRHDAEVEIYDNETRQTVDFTFGDYQFITKAGTFNDRFVIHKTSGGVTAVDNGFRLDGMTVTAFDGGIDIEGQFKGKVQIYSESGMLMAEPKQSGRVQLDGGVYIIKIGDRSIKLSKM